MKVERTNPIHLILFGILIAMMLIVSDDASAESEADWAVAGDVTFSHSYGGYVHGVDLGGEGFYIQPSFTVSHETGFYAGIFLTNGHGFLDYEYDPYIGYATTISNFSVNIAASTFYIKEEGSTDQIRTIGGTISYNREGIVPSIAFEHNYNDPDDYGFGRGTAYLLGASLHNFTLGVGGQDGLNYSDSGITFARISYSSNPVKSLFDAVITVEGQFGFEKARNAIDASDFQVSLHIPL